MAKVGATITLDASSINKEVDRLALGGRAYDMLHINTDGDGVDKFPAQSHGNDWVGRSRVKLHRSGFTNSTTATMYTNDILDMLRLINPDLQINNLEIK
jgi:hypothetical protein